MVNSLQQYVDTFEALGDPNAIYEYVLDFGSDLNEDIERIQENFVYGCQSEVWVEGQEDALGWNFKLVSDAYIVNGIGNIICDCMQGLSTPEVESIQWEDLAPLGRYFSQQRKQGMQAILNKCKRIVRGEE